ncbi:MAG: hypothetical protein GY820_24210 [Gammaproteobacteria bacterium]|nr:hypothetical protein [Gammaproteobacteria bacterium]
MEKEDEATKPSAAESLSPSKSPQKKRSRDNGVPLPSHEFTCRICLSEYESRSDLDEHVLFDHELGNEESPSSPQANERPAPILSEMIMGRSFILCLKRCPQITQFWKEVLL